MGLHRDFCYRGRFWVGSLLWQQEARGYPQVTSQSLKPPWNDTGVVTLPYIIHLGHTQTFSYGTVPGQGLNDQGWLRICGHRGAWSHMHVIL